MRTNAAKLVEAEACPKCGCTKRMASNGKCHECYKARGRKHHAEHKNKHDWARKLLKTARSKSKKRGHPPPTITEAWIFEQIETYSNCPYTGVPLVPWSHDSGGRRKRPWAPSLDRIDNSLGYTPENVRLTSHFWNTLRWELPIEEALEAIQDFVRCMTQGGRTPRCAINRGLPRWPTPSKV